MPTYTDIENTGAPVVPDMRTNYDRETSLEETVRSHRLAEPTADPADFTDSNDSIDD
jgi:hypothetical protein